MKVTDGGAIKPLNPWISNLLTIIGLAIGWFIVNYVLTRSIETAAFDAVLYILFFLVVNLILVLLKKRPFLLKF